MIAAYVDNVPEVEQQIHSVHIHVGNDLGARHRGVLCKVVRSEQARLFACQRDEDNGAARAVPQAREGSRDLDECCVSTGVVGGPL